MRYIIRWLFVSGGAITLARAMSGPLARTDDRRLVRGGFLLLAGSWLLTIIDAFIPVMTAAPLGLLLFLLATVVSVASAIAAALLAGLVLARRTGRIPGQQPTIRIPLALPLWLIAAAAFSFLGERILSLIAAVSN